MDSIINEHYYEHVPQHACVKISDGQNNDKHCVKLSPSRLTPTLEQKLVFTQIIFLQTNSPLTKVLFPPRQMKALTNYSN